MKLLNTLLSGSSIALLVVAGIIALSGRTNTFGGYHVYSVLTGSMEPTIPVQSALLVHNNDPRQIKRGDVITFDEPGKHGVLITHRVIEIDHANSTLMFHTKGDANPRPDAWIVPPDRILGTVVYHVRTIGGFITFLNTRLGIALFVLLPVLLLAYQDIYTIHSTLFEMQLEQASRRS